MGFRFGDYEIDVERFELRRHGEPVALEPQVFDLLVHLVRNRDRLVTKADLLDHVWGDRFVSESALTSRVKALRRAVGDDGRTQAVIRTVRGRGYRFVAAVTDDEPEPALPGPGPPGAPPEQRVRFCRARDGTRLAFATSGAGRPLVKAANWLGHLEYDWETPVWRHWWTGLSRAHTLVRYDERGCGLSDWDVDRFTLEAYVDDLATVVDAAGLDRFDLLGVSQGGAVAVSYAAAHPERVDRLVIYGAYERGRAARALTAEQREDAELQVRLVRVGWGSDDLSFRRVFAMQFLPQGTYEQWEAFAELQRHTTSAENAARFLESFGAIDVGDVATQVTAPTLALHARDDRRVPLEQGRRLAAAIPHSRFVTLDSANHLLLDGEPAWARFLAEVEGFLAEGR